MRFKDESNLSLLLFNGQCVGETLFTFDISTVERLYLDEN